MTIQFTKFKSNKVLPGQLIDFVLKDQHYGVLSDEFQKAVAERDARNILEGINSIILNAETKFNIHLSESDRFKLQMVVQDEIIAGMLAEAEKMILGRQDKARELRELCENLSKTNEVINYRLEFVDKDGVYAG